MLCRGALKGAEFVIREASDGCEGLVAVEQDPPDVVLMDVVMPNMDGLECTRRLKANPATRDIPVIIVSGCTDAKEVVAGLDAGADEYLAKPFSVAELRVRVRSMVRQRRNQLELIRARERDAATRALEAELVERRRIEEELRAAKEAAEVASRAKSDFLATMSHELRTPLNGVIGMTELLLRTTLSDQQRRYASIARQSGETLCCLINDVLDISKVEAGKLELESVEFDLQSALDCVLTTLEAAAKAKGLALGGAIHPQAPRRFVGDPGRLQQILLNLAGNAIKFTEHGRVFIRAVLEDETPSASLIRFTVDDTGIGIPADRTDRLFKLFSQVDASTTRKYGGTGLGLAISSRLVGLMGGQIGVCSEPGLGSTFWFTLRLTRAEGPSPVFGAMACDLRALRVLVVEDDAAGAKALMQQLSSCNITARASSTSDSALLALKAAAGRGDPFSVALIGLSNPGAGEELAAAIRAEPALRDAVLIRLSSDTQTCEAADIMTLGFAGCLKQPTSAASLLDGLAGALACATRLVDSHADRRDIRFRRSASQVGTTPLRVLLAEDNAIGREVAVATIVRAGHECDTAKDGQEALQAAVRQRFDVILMDCQMPNMDGFEATRAIRQHEESLAHAGAHPRRIPIIALTANAIQGDRERCLAAGMDDYLTKPFAMDELIRTIERYGREAEPSGPAQPDAANSPAIDAATPLAADSAVDAAAPAAPDVDEIALPPEGSMNPVAPAFNMEDLKQRWGGDPQFVESLIVRFCDQIGGELAHLERNLEEQQTVEFTRYAHGIKGAASYVCAEGVRANAAALEQLGIAGRLQDAGEFLAALRSEVQRCVETVAQGVSA